MDGLKKRITKGTVTAEDATPRVIPHLVAPFNAELMYPSHTPNNVRTKMELFHATGAGEEIRDVIKRLDRQQTVLYIGGQFNVGRGVYFATTAKAARDKSQFLGEKK